MSSQNEAKRGYLLEDWFKYRLAKNATKPPESTQEPLISSAEVELVPAKHQGHGSGARRDVLALSLPFREFCEFGSDPNGINFDKEIANLPATVPGQPVLYFPKSRTFPGWDFVYDNGHMAVFFQVSVSKLADKQKSISDAISTVSNCSPLINVAVDQAAEPPARFCPSCAAAVSKTRRWSTLGSK